MTSVLAVGDDELALGDDDDASSEAAEGMGTCGSAQELTWMGNRETGKPGSGLPALPGDRGKKQVT